MPESNTDRVIVVSDVNVRNKADCILSQENVHILKGHESIVEMIDVDSGLPLAVQVVHKDGNIEIINVPVGESEAVVGQNVDKMEADSVGESWADKVEMEDKEEQAKELLQEWGPEDSEESIDSAILRLVAEVMEIEQLTQEKRFREIPAVIEKWTRIDEERKAEKKQKAEQNQFEEEQNRERVEREIEAERKQKENEEQEEKKRKIKEGKLKEQGAGSSRL